MFVYTVLLNLTCRCSFLLYLNLGSLSSGNALWNRKDNITFVFNCCLPYGMCKDAKNILNPDLKPLNDTLYQFDKIWSKLNRNMLSLNCDCPNIILLTRHWPKIIVALHPPEMPERSIESDVPSSFYRVSLWNLRNWYIVHEQCQKWRRLEIVQMFFFCFSLAVYNFKHMSSYLCCAALFDFYDEVQSSAVNGYNDEQTCYNVID